MFVVGVERYCLGLDKVFDSSSLCLFEDFHGKENNIFIRKLGKSSQFTQQNLIHNKNWYYWDLNYQDYRLFINLMQTGDTVYHCAKYANYIRVPV